MLPAASRLRASADFSATVRRGVRAARPTVVVHARVRTPAPTDPVGGQESVARVGFVVSKAVGNAVTRNRVKRRLRHLVAAALPTLPGGVELVVRALPPAASQPERVVHDLEGALQAAMARLELPEAVAR